MIQSDFQPLAGTMTDEESGKDGNVLEKQEQHLRSKYGNIDKRKGSAMSGIYALYRMLSKAFTQT